MTPEFTARDIIWLLGPSWLAVRNRWRHRVRGDWLRFSLFAVVTLVFCLGIFGGFHRALTYIGAFPEFTAHLTQQILATVVTFVFTVLLASNVITALATQYLSEDLSLLSSSPVPLPALYSARLVLTLLQSSWMVLVFSVPVFLAFAVVSDSPWRFLLSVAVALPPIIVIPAVVGSAITSALLSVFPARRVKETLILVSALFIGLLVFLIRAQQPEKLLNPRAIYDVAEFFSAFRAPSLPLLPSSWAMDVMSAGRHGEPLPAMPLALLWSTAAAMVVLGCWTARGLYRLAYSRAQESRPARLSALPSVDRFLEVSTRAFEVRFRSLLLKDIRSFLRDTTQWSQLLLLLALVAVYLYNFSVLPASFTFSHFYLQNVFSFLNLGLAGFVLSAVAVRFVFTSVSSEGPAFWLIRASPLPLDRFLWSKFWTSLPPLLLLSQVLTVASNYFLGASTFMTLLASATIVGVTFGIVGMGVGMGAMFPRFKFENVTQIAGSSGGLLYMIASSSFIALVLFLEAVPVFFYFSYRARGSPDSSLVALVLAAALGAIVALNVAAVLVPMRLGQKRLAALEF